MFNFVVMDDFWFNALSIKRVDDFPEKIDGGIRRKRRKKGNLFRQNPDGQGLSFAVQDNTMVQRPFDRSIIQPNIANKSPEEAAQRMATRETGEKVPHRKLYGLGLLGLSTYGNNCAATVTDSYGFREINNDRFQNNYQKYGFEQLPRTGYAPLPGDIIQLHEENSLSNRPHHMGMITDSNTVHHAPGIPFVKNIRSSNFYGDDIRKGGD